MIIERDSDDVARCFALERLLYQHGHDQVFAGEIAGLISVGAFIAFGLDADAADGNGRGEGAIDAASFEGMLPVRLLRAPSRERDGGREWWELNEQGTILQGERTGATLRLGDPVEVRVASVDSIRGRVDLVPAP
jgi:ribonuclease R